MCIKTDTCKFVYLSNLNIVYINFIKINVPPELVSDPEKVL